MILNFIDILKRKHANKKQRQIIENFHTLYYNNSERTWRNTNWLGINVLKCPLDLWIYQEILFEVKPDLIIETGTYVGGSAYFLASIMDLLENGEIVTIDSEIRGNLPKHKRINYLNGLSTSIEIIEKVKTFTKNKKRILVILDSDHSKENVLKEMRIYNKFVSKDSYLIVEDSNINGHPTLPEFGPGPWEAINSFLNENKEFKIDKEKEKFYFTLNPNGYLKKQ
ncbi:MAG TPA: CmcI family methyltransferase [Candidatus Gastranaerophilaceae bacterium]|nr:CmcI family methyltransferase [Candidatus Gastranaerophilaceae bacterium]